MRHPALSVPSTLQATPYERSAQRVDHANGYKNKGRPDPHGRGHLRGAASALWWLLSQRTPVARQIRGIFNAPDAHEAQRLLNGALKEWQVSHPQLAAWAEKNLPEGFAVFDLPEAHRVRMRTTNGLERLNKELKRRTRVATLFPNLESCLRLISALLAEQDEEWMTAKIYLTMNP
jgi:putative transposase